MRYEYILALILISSSPALADTRMVTFYADGALVDLEVTAAKGNAVIPLPKGISTNSLRIRPLGESQIQQVDIQATKPAGKADKELDGLAERKNRLEDRLQALATREEIFKSAAKSQSGKAPRKTKSNPDPMQSIRQGTEFAIAQLEAVYTARRKTTQEIRTLETRIAELHATGVGAESVARIAVTPKNGRIKVRYALVGQGWTARYDLRLKGNGTAALTMYALLPTSFGSFQQSAAPGTLADSTSTRAVPVAGGTLAKLGEYVLTAEEERFGSGITGSYSALLTNLGGVFLPAGDASLYRADEYIGRLRFEGISSGRSKRVSTAR